MKLGCRLWLLFFVLAATALAKKGKKKDRKSAPQWKPSSMAALNKRSEDIYEGKDLTLECKAQGQPKPTVTWQKDGVKLRNTDKIEVNKFVLNLKSVSTDMSGNYTCIVSNKHGQLEWTLHLEVQVKIWPLIVEGPNNITQMVDSNVSFRCRVLNDPQATIRWQRIANSKNRDENAPQADFLPDGESPEILMLKNIKKEDEGEYRCMAGNVWGLKYSTAWLSVIERVLVPQIPPVSEPGMRNNNVGEPELPKGYYDPYSRNNLDNMNTGDAFYNGNLEEDFDSDVDFTTTRRSKNRNKVGNKGKGGKKDKKGKDRNQFDNEEVEEDNVVAATTTAFTSTTTAKSSVTTTEVNLYRTSSLDIWNFEDDSNESDQIVDTRYNPVNPSKDERSQSGSTGTVKASGASDTPKGSISSWTIYTIVGAVGGVILLVGLVAITLTLCCKREEGGTYKSTPV